MISLFAYRLALILLLPLLLIVFLLRSKNNADYRKRLTERFGFFPQPNQTGGIIVHAASVGEVIALKTFIEKLIKAYPDLPITVTTFTPTGSAQVKKLFANRVQHGYLPLDLFPCTALFLQQLKPRMIIFMETELWPNLIAQCKNRQIKLLLINGRLSTKSLRSYSKLIKLISPCLNRFNKILTQSLENRDNFIQLGAAPETCLNSGNLKFDISINAEITEKQAELAKLLFTNNDKAKRTIWLVASSHEGDEAIVLEAFNRLIKQYPTLLLVLVPRHPERFEQVAQLCLKQNFSLAKRSENTALTNHQIWLLDSLGELMPAFSLSDIVTMGGSFSMVGGHNPLEPALFSKPIIVGHNMSNFNEIMQQLRQEHAIVELPKDSPDKHLAEQVSHLLQEPAQQKVLGEQALKVVMQNQGASDTTLAVVKQLLGESA